MTTIIRVFDNGGKTWDRYTIVIDGSVYGMSETPRSPMGFNQFNGSIAECTAVLECLNGAVDENIGREKELLSLPLEVRLAIGDRMRSE